jgi:hypothetical protein
MMQATNSPCFPVPMMTCLPGLAHVLTPSPFLLHTDAASARDTARALDMSAQGG